MNPYTARLDVIARRGRRNRRILLGTWVAFWTLVGLLSHDLAIVPLALLFTAAPTFFVVWLMSFNTNSHLKRARQAMQDEMAAVHYAQMVNQYR